MPRELEEWGGEVRMPRWMRRVLRRPREPEDTPERRGEPRSSAPARSVLEQANRAAGGGLMVDFHNEGRARRGR